MFKYLSQADLTIALDIRRSTKSHVIKSFRGALNAHLNLLLGLPSRSPPLCLPTPDGEILKMLKSGRKITFFAKLSTQGHCPQDISQLFIDNLILIKKL